MRERRHAADGKPGVSLRLVCRGPADRSGAANVLEAFDAHAVIAAAEHNERPSVGDEHERLHDAAHFRADLTCGVLGRAGRGRESPDRKLDSAFVRVGANTRDVGVIRGQRPRLVMKRSTLPGSSASITEAT